MLLKLTFFASFVVFLYSYSAGTYEKTPLNEKNILLLIMIKFGYDYDIFLGIYVDAKAMF